MNVFQTHAEMVQHVWMGLTLTLASAFQDTQVFIVKQTSMNVPVTLVQMEVSAWISSMASSATALVATSMLVACPM